MIINKCKNPDTTCEDGVCPECNWYKFQLWQEEHAHCAQPSWDCPDVKDCPHKILPHIGVIISEQTEGLRQKYL